MTAHALPSSAEACASPRPSVDRLAAALDAAARGWLVFPLEPGTNLPRHVDWRAQATRNVGQLRAWWRECPDANVGGSTDDKLVVAIVADGGARDGRGSFAKAMKSTSPPGTLFPKTTVFRGCPAGVDFVAYELAPGATAVSEANALGIGLDVLSAASYVVLPGSTVDGTPVAWVNDNGVAAAMDWMVHLCGSALPCAIAAEPCNPEISIASATLADGEKDNLMRVVDTSEPALAYPATKAGGEDWINTDAPSASGDNRFAVACDVARRLRRDFNMSESKVAASVEDWSVAWCDPPLSIVERRAVCEYAKLHGPSSTSPSEVRLPADKPKVEWALEAVRRGFGFSVFPVRGYEAPGPGATSGEHELAEKKAKAPAISGWQNLATTDEAQIREWWPVGSDRNIGIPTDNYLVVDIDPRHGGDTTFAGLQLEDDFPETAETRTQSGGSHRIYVLPPHTHVKGGADVLGPGIDIRSRGNLIVAPGSTVAGRSYTWANDRPVALAPQWLIDRCKTHTPRTKEAGKRLVDEDDIAVALAQNWLDHHAPDADLGTIDNTAHRVAAQFYDFGVSRSTATNMLADWSETHARPPMATSDIQRVARSAETSRANAIGIRHPNAPHGFEPVEISIEAFAPPLSRPPTPLDSGLATPLRRFDPATIPPVPWIVPGLAARQLVSALVGPGGVSKSSWLLHLGVANASGRSDISGFPIPKKQCTWVWSQEDTIDLMELRVAAIMQAFGVTYEDMLDQNGRPLLYLNSGVGKGKRLKLASRDKDVVSGGAHLASVIASAKTIGAQLVVMDPIISFHDSPENDNVQVRKVVDFISDIASDADCAVQLVAHTGKPDKASSRGFAGDPNAARGASALIDAVRVATTFVSMSEQDTKEWSIPPSASHLDYVRIDDAKMNIGKKRREPRWFRREEVVIPGFVGDSMEVLRPVFLEKRIRSSVDLLEVFAKVIVEQQLPLEIFHTIAALTPHLDTSIADALKQKNRSRTLDTAFGGAAISEYITTAGVLERKTFQGQRGTCFKLRANASMPQTPMRQS